MCIVCGRLQYVPILYAYQCVYSKLEIRAGQNAAFKNK